MRYGLGIPVWVLLLGGQLFPLVAQDSFSVASFNVKNYLLTSIPGRKAKPSAARERVQQTLLHARVDVVVLQEMGRANALEELRRRLADGGLDYPHCRLQQGADPAIRLAVLSRYPIERVVWHTNDQYLIEGRRQWIRRGFLEAEIAVGDDYRFTLLAAHLKSKFQVPQARESDIRRKEAAILRSKVENLLAGDPDLNLMVVGDLNDTPDSVPVRTVMGRGKLRLFDVKPHEWVFVDGQFVIERPRVQWTYHYPAGGAYTRVDYVLLSRGMKPEWRPDSSHIAGVPYWFEASDHRLLKIGFSTDER
jgi:endonuclease/exonuclease/phosphatase family metal-dependent hydrolase